VASANFLLRSHFRKDNPVSVIVEEDFKHLTANKKGALVMDIIQGKTSIAQASWSFDLPPSEIEEWGRRA
jgi:hypothetical protein